MNFNSAGTDAARTELRRSWRVACVAAIGMFSTSVPGSALSVFVQPWMTGNHWSISAIERLVIFLGLGGAVAGPAAGRIVDRYGPRVAVVMYIVVNVVFVAAGALIGHQIWELYLLMFIWGAIGGLAAGYIGGINRVFVAGRGRALMIMYVGLGMGGAIGPSVGTYLVDHYGCQMTWLCFAIVASLPTPFALRWFRGTACSGSGSVTVLAGSEGMECGVAVRTAVFWLLASAWFLAVTASCATIFLAPFMTDLGWTRGRAARLIGLLNISIALGQPAVGIMLEQIPVVQFTCLSFIVYAVADVILAAFGARFSMTAVFLSSIGQCALGACLVFCVTQKFGIRAFGELSGLLGRVISGGVIVGSLLFGEIHDLFGGYRVGYLAAGVIFIAAAICVAFTSRDESGGKSD